MPNIYSVTQVNSYIKNMFTQDFMLKSVFVRGEASNVKYHSSGHVYFTLKDQKGTIACVMFAGNRNGLAFRLAEGQQIVVGGSVDVYERDGKYQIYAKEIVLDGGGALYQKFEQLKKELEEMGMFSEEYKRPIPKYIKRLGIVTASTGAAVHDIIQIATRRNPYVEIILFPAIVQGEQAAASIINGIHALEQLQVDVMIVGRGGGSMEDLWAFNEAAVARAIFDCTVPVISAVGHETDVTIADFVADLRAPTPSAAAELAVFEYEEYLRRMQDYQHKLLQVFRQKNENIRHELEKIKWKLNYLSPINHLKEQKMYALSMEEKLQELIKRRILRERHQFQLYLEKLKGLSPLEKLNQGYSFVSDAQGKVLKDIRKVKIGDAIRIEMKNGNMEAMVTDIMPSRLLESNGKEGMA